MSDIGDFDDLSTHEFADTIKATEGDDFDILDESKIQGDIQRAYGIFLELNPNATAEDNPELAAFSEDLHNILADFDAAGRDKEEALYDLEDEIYALLEPILKEDAFRVLEKSFYSVYDFILDSVDFAGGKRSFSFEYDGEVVAGSFNREYRIEVVEIGDKRIEFNPPCSPRNLEQVFLFFKRALDRITERDDMYSFLDTAPTFVALDLLRFDFFIDRGDGPVKYVATPFDVLRVDEESERRMEVQEEEYRRKKRDIGSMIRSGAYQGDWLETSSELQQASRISRTLYDDETGSEVEEVTSADQEFSVSRYYSDGDEFSEMYFSEYGGSNTTDANGNITSYDSQLKPTETRLVDDNGIFEGYNFYDSSGRPLWGSDKENLPFLVQPDGGSLYNFALMREREPQLTTKDFFDSWKEIIRTEDDYYAFEEQFLTINEGDIPYLAQKLLEGGAWQPFSEPEMSDIEALHLVRGHLQEVFPEDLQLMMREHAKELTGVAALEASIEQKYGIEIESDDWSSFGRSRISNMRMELSMLRRVLRDLDASLYKIHPVALKRTGLKKIYIFKFWETRTAEWKSYRAGGFAFGNGEIAISDGKSLFLHELGHCADEHEGGLSNENEYWGIRSHGEAYEPLYGKSGAAAHSSGMDLTDRPYGFVSAYAKHGGINEDQAEMNGYLFDNYEFIMKLAEQEPELARKVEMTKHFWLWLSDPNGGESYDPTATYNGYMNDQYFEDLADDKVARSGVIGPGYWDS